MTQTQAVTARAQALLDDPPTRWTTANALYDALQAAMAQYPGLTAQGYWAMA